MIYRLIDLPPNVIGFKAQWQFTEKDFEEVMVPLVKESNSSTSKLNCLIVINNSIKHFQVSAFKSVKHLFKGKSQWRRVAIVSESRTAKLFINFISILINGEFKVFSHEKLDQAIHWASEEKN